MRVVVTGASGNVGSQVLSHLAAHGEVSELIGLCRRPPTEQPGALAGVRWEPVDLADPGCPLRLRRLFTGADAVVHLAWQIQPSHDIAAMRAVNVDGTRRVAEAVVAAGVPALVVASSVGAYSPGPKDRAVDESWPTDGIPTSTYSRHKAAVERLLDRLGTDYPQLRIVRIRPGLVFQQQAASEIARYFLGPLVPRRLLRRGRIPLVPAIEGLRFQAVHASDVGRGFALATTGTASGAFNLAAEPVLDPPELARTLRARPVPVPTSALPLLRGLVTATWRLRLQPTSAGWLDLALDAPLMDTTRARTELGWEPEHSATDALLELIGGMAAGEGGGTPVLAPAMAAPHRLLDTVKTMVGGRAD